MTKTNTDPKKIIVFGDWHGNTQFALKALNYAYVEEFADIYLHVGDFGIWPQTISKKSNSYISLLEKELTSQDKELWFIDGNHENFEILENLKSDSRGLGIVSPHIFHIPRGHQWEWNGKKILGFGGSVSIDRNDRTPYISYFPQEEISMSDLNTALQKEDVDIIISHDAPSGYKPVPDRKFGKDIDEDCERSTEIIKFLIDKWNPELLVHGHYHTKSEKLYNNTSIISLSNDYSLNEMQAIYDNYYKIIIP